MLLVMSGSLTVQYFKKIMYRSIGPSNNLFKSILNVFLFCLVNDLNIHKNNVNMYSSSHCLDWTDAVLLNPLHSKVKKRTEVFF